MSKKLYIAEVTIFMPIYAESEEEADRLALRHYREEEVEFVDLNPMSQKDMIEYGNCLPWGGDAVAVCRELIGE